MPRQPRLDAPGAIQHIWARGIAQQALFIDDTDGNDFIERLDRVLPESGVACLAWALMSNHVHLVLQGGEHGISKPLHRVLGGFAGAFNRRHSRAGHVFQNRFGSRIALDDADLMGLVRYVCLNPIHAGIVDDLRALEDHPWTIYPALTGRRGRARFECVDAVLAMFAEEPGLAKQRLARFMRDGLTERTAQSDPSQVLGVDDVVAIVSAHARVNPASIASRSHARAISNARALISFVAVDRLGLKPRDVALALGVTESAVSHSRRRGSALLTRDTAESLTKAFKFQVRPPLER